MSRTTILLIIILSLSLAACGELRGVPPPQPWEPAAGDEKLSRGEVMISESELLVQESEPAQYTLFLSGTLPTPCHQLRVNILEPNDKDQIKIEVYSLVDPAEICIQVLEPFEVNVPLGTYSSGTYELLVNDQLVGEISL